MEDNFSWLLARYLNKEVQLDTDKEALVVPLMIRVMGESDFVATNDSTKVLREAREGRFYHQSKHTSIELVDDGATTVLYFLLYQGLVWGGVRLQFAE